MTDLMATHDLSELRQMILSARKEVEKIQKKRKSNNIGEWVQWVSSVTGAMHFTRRSVYSSP